MLGLAAWILAAGTASAGVSPSPTSTAHWWEKVTYTISDEGEQRACRYESSLEVARSCHEEEGEVTAGQGPVVAYTKITIERRFNPGSAPERIDLNSADTLLGGQIMSVAIDGGGQVQSCKIVGTSGDIRPDYGCDQLSAEKFEASATKASAEVRQGFMTVLVYGHEESIT